MGAQRDREPGSMESFSACLGDLLQSHSKSCLRQRIGLKAFRGPVQAKLGIKPVNKLCFMDRRIKLRD